MFVHGTGAAANRWEGVVSHLNHRYRCVSYDRRGRGASGDGSAYCLADEVADLAAVMQHADNNNPVHVVAHSFGALLALGLLQQQPTLFRHLVLYEAPVSTSADSRFIELSAVAALELTRREQGDEAALVFFQRQFPRATEQDITQMKTLSSWQRRVEAAPTLARELRAAVQFQPERNNLSGNSVPCLLLLGGESMKAFQKSARDLSAWIGKATLEVLPGQRHRAMDRIPEVVATSIMAFLGDADNKRSKL